MKVNSTTKWCFALVATITLFYWKYFFPSQFSYLAGAEDANQGYSWLHFWLRSLRHGALPVWDPNASAGYCFPGEMQTAAFYPLYVVAFLFRERHGMISQMGYHMLLLMAHVLAALFMFALIREFRLSRFAAFIAGICFSTGGFVGRVAWPHMLHSSIWLPAILLFTLRALKASNRRQLVSNSLLGSACMGLSILAGGLHIVIAQGIVIATALGYYGYRQWVAKQEHMRRLVFSRPVWIALAVIVVGLCAGAVQLIPSHVYADRSLRWYGDMALRGTQKPPYMYVAADSLWANGVASILFPEYPSRGQGEFWPPYIGALPALLAVIAIAKCWSNLWIRYFTGLGLAAILYTMTSVSLLHGLLYAVVPWLWLAREATRFLYLTAFSLTVLAAFGLDLVLSPLRDEVFGPASKKLLRRAMATCGIALLIPAFYPPFGSTWVWLAVLMILAACAVLYRAQAGSAVLGSGFRMLVAALVLFDLGGYYWGPPNRLQATKTGTDEYGTLMSLGGVADFLRHQPELYRVKIFRDRQPNIADAFGIPSVSGAGVTLGINFFRVIGDLDLLNVRYLIKPASTPDPGALYGDTYWKIYPNPTGFSRGWIVHQTKVVPDDDELYRRLHSGEVNLHNTALLSTPPGRSFGAGEPQSHETVRFKTYSADRMKIAVHAEQPGLLVLSEMYYPEWHAIVNGNEAPIYRANGAFRSVPVPQGDSEVELVYRPWTVYFGGALSVTVFLAAFIAACLTWRELWRPSRVDEEISEPTYEWASYGQQFER